MLIKLEDLKFKLFNCSLKESCQGAIINKCQTRNIQQSLACSRLSVSEDNRKSERAKSGISGKRDPGEKRRGRESL